MYDLVIIGGGPAGVAAGVYAARKKIKTLLIAKEFGGQSLISADIQNWIGVKKLTGLEFDIPRVVRELNSAGMSINVYNTAPGMKYGFTRDF